MVGLAIAIVLGMLFAILMSQAKWVERSLFPYAVVLQTIPILALVPLIGFWFEFNFRSRVIVCVLIAIFPIINNTLFGLLSADQGQHDLFTLHDSSRFTRLWRLQLPAGMPAIFSGFRISAGLAVIGAIVGDFFFRQGDPGIGKLIDNYSRASNPRSSSERSSSRPCSDSSSSGCSGSSATASSGHVARDRAKAELISAPEQHLQGGHMRKTTKAAWLAVPLAGFLFLAACGDDSDSSSATTGGGAATTGAGAATTGSGAATTGASGGEAGSLAGVCPDTVIVQTDWNPEAEHGGLYQLVGPDPQIDTDKKAVTGELMASGGVDTGVKIEVRVGGPAIGFQQVTAQLYTDDSILLGYVSNDEAVQNSADKPTIAPDGAAEEEPADRDVGPGDLPRCQDHRRPSRHHDDPGVRRRRVPRLPRRQGHRAAEPDRGRLRRHTRLASSPRAARSRSRASLRPSRTSTRTRCPEWGKPVAFQLIHDTGLEIYSQTMSTRPENVTKFADCFKKLIPIMQQADVDYAADPAATNALIVDLVKQYDTGWVYSEGVADFSVEQQVKLELVGNEDGYSGGIDDARVQGVIDNLVPIFDAKGVKVKDGLNAADIIDLQFVDKNIQF